MSLNGLCNRIKGSGERWGGIGGQREAAAFQQHTQRVGGSQRKVAVGIESCQESAGGSGGGLQRSADAF